MNIISFYSDPKDSWSGDGLYHIGYFELPNVKSGWVELAKTERPEIAKIIALALQDYVNAIGEGK